MGDTAVTQSPINDDDPCENIDQLDGNVSLASSILSFNEPDDDLCGQQITVQVGLRPGHSLGARLPPVRGHH